jgi:hypothetical protein
MEYFVHTIRISHPADAREASPEVEEGGEEGESCKFSSFH